MTVSAGSDSGLWRLTPCDTGILAPGRWFWFRAVAWMLGLFAWAALVFFTALLLGDWLGLPDSFEMPIAIVIPLVGVAGYALAVKFAERRPLAELSLRGAVADLAGGAGIGFSFIALSLLAVWLAGYVTIAPGHWAHWFQYLVFNAWVSAVVEELGFRLILLRIFARMFGPVAGLLISSVLFALAHAGHASPPVVALLIVDGGMLLGMTYLATGRIWAPVAAHIAYDWAEWSLFGVKNTHGVIAITPLPQFPVWLSGGVDGPDASVLSAPVAIALLVAIVAFCRWRAGYSTSSSRAAPHPLPSGPPAGI